MSTALITPLTSGEAVLEQDGIPRLFPNWRAAAAEADARHLRWSLDRFPPTPVPAEPAPLPSS